MFYKTAHGPLHLSGHEALGLVNLWVTVVNSQSVAWNSYLDSWLALLCYEFLAVRRGLDYVALSVTASFDIVSRPPYSPR